MAGGRSEVEANPRAIREGDAEIGQAQPGLGFRRLAQRSGRAAASAEEM